MGERQRLDLGGNQSLSHSRRSTFRRCRRLYFLNYIVGLQPRETPAPLRMGSIYSDGLEAADPNVVRTEYSELVAEAMHEGKFRFADQLLDELAVVEPMVETYLAKVSLPDIVREVPFTGPSFQGYQDNGFFDGIGEPLNPNDKLLLVENKLKGRFGNAEELALETDEQLLGYILNACIKYDVTPDKVEVRYEVAKKPGLRQGKNETRDVFRARVASDIRSRPEFYHVVIPGSRLGRTQSQLDQWMSEFERMVKDLHQEEHYASLEETSKYAYPMNRDSCHQYGSCPMLKICGAKDDEAMMLEIQKNFTTPDERNS